MSQSTNLPNTPEVSESLAGIEEILKETVNQLELERIPMKERGRPKILPSLCLWSAVLLTVLKGWTSQAAVWKLIRRKGFWHFPRFQITDQAVYKRLDQADGTPMIEFFLTISKLLASRVERFVKVRLAPFAAGVYALDETTLDPVSKTLVDLRSIPTGDTALLPGKLSTLFDIRTQQFTAVIHRPKATENDKVAARDMLTFLQAGSLILADLGYFAFKWFDDLTAAGHFFVSRMRKKTSYIVKHVFYQDSSVWDGIVTLGAHRADRSAHPVRLVRFKVKQTTYEYITNVMDPRVLTIADIAMIYARRWDIELAFKTIKRELHLHMMWSAKINVILHQVYAVLAIAQILQALRLEIADRANVDIFDVSLPLMIQNFPDIAAEGDPDPVGEYVRDGVGLRFIRPSRRIRIEVPRVDHLSIDPAPSEVFDPQKPRYAERKCGPRKR
jgi:hypothetical protein